MGFLSDVGNAVSSGASAIGDAVESGVDAVVDTVEDGVGKIIDTVRDGIGAGTEWLCKNKPGGLVVGELACGFGNILGGILDGVLKGGLDILHDAFDIIRDLGGIVGSILRLDLPGLIKDLGDLGLDIVDGLIDVTRFFTGGYLVGGIVDKFRRSRLMHFVEELIDTEFMDDPERRLIARRNIGLEGGRFGFRLPAQHRVFVMDSAEVDLWQMHDDEIIDLYAMAGLLSFDSFSLTTFHPNTVVKSVGTDGNDNWWPVTRWTISKYLESHGQNERLRVYAMSRQTVAQMLDTATRKLDEIGVILEWNDSEDFAWFRDYTRQPIPETVEVVPQSQITIPGQPPPDTIPQSVYDFDEEYIEQLLEMPGFDREPGINCELVALAAFKLVKTGQVAGRYIDQCADFPDDCETPGRTDRCCNTIVRTQSSGVIYRDRYPTDMMQYVLAHEIGHYLGLCHCCHTFDSVIWTPPWRDEDAHYLGWGLGSFYWDSEPHFSLKDGKNAWRFIVDQMRACLTGEDEPRPSAPIVGGIISSPGTCADVIRVVRGEEPEEPEQPIVD